MLCSIRMEHGRNAGDSASQITRAVRWRRQHPVASPASPIEQVPACQPAGPLFSASPHWQIASSKRRDGRPMRRREQHSLTSIRTLRRSGVHRLVCCDKVDSPDGLPGRAGVQFGDGYTWFEASAAMLIRSALFWDITQRRLVILYRRFGTTYRSVPSSSIKKSKKKGLLHPWTWDTLSRNVGKGLPLHAAWTSWPLKMGPTRFPKRR